MAGFFICLPSEAPWAKECHSRERGNPGLWWVAHSNNAYFRPSGELGDIKKKEEY